MTPLSARHCCTAGSLSPAPPASPLAAGEPEIPGAGTGLVGLAERATLSGGSLVHGLDEAGDFQLRAWLPWPK